MDFDDFTGYDLVKADQGVEKTLTRGTTKLKFKVRFRDQFTQAADAEYKRARAPFAKAIESGAFDTLDYLRIALAYVHLAGWEGVTNKGKEVKFTPDAAYAFFGVETNKWMIGELMTFGNDANNYAPDVEADAETVTKNS